MQARLEGDVKNTPANSICRSATVTPTCVGNDYALRQTAENSLRQSNQIVVPRAQSDGVSGSSSWFNSSNTRLASVSFTTLMAKPT